MLKDTLQSDIEKYIRLYNLNEKLGFSKNFTVEFLAQGEYNINFTINVPEKRYVFRVNTGSQLELDNQIKYEYDALKTLEISGVTPKVYYLDDSKEFFNYGILIMEFLKGRPLEYDKDLVDAGKIFAGIHSLNLEEINTDNFIVEDKLFTDRVIEAKRLLKDFLVSEKVDDRLKGFFREFLQWAEENKDKEKYFTEDKWHVINNTEVNSHNFIIGDKKSYLVDWEKPVISDPCQDLTQFLVPTTTLWKANYILSREEKENFFNIYVKGLKGGNKNIRERVHLYTPYMYLRALSWCAYAWLEYQNPNKQIKNMDTFRKIESYLEVDFMKKLLKNYI